MQVVVAFIAGFIFSIGLGLAQMTDPEKVRGFLDIFGNWVLNTAQASSVLGNKWQCWVERLAGFGDIYDRLKNNLPVVVSVKGPLPGARFPYTNGHLIAVKGYNPKTEQVLCMDPAFQADEATAVAYNLSDFMDAWSRRRRIAYVFEPSRP